ncbi:hypothetical protein BH11PSE9_BH11PSE9_15330 [soil metagenome]
MRTISIRQNEAGEWFVTVFQNPRSFLSHIGYPTRAQAFRAFVTEGREQPYARMIVWAAGATKAVVIRGRVRAAEERGAAMELMDRLRRSVLAALAESRHAGAPDDGSRDAFAAAPKPADASASASASAAGNALRNSLRDSPRDALKT